MLEIPAFRMQSQAQGFVSRQLGLATQKVPGPLGILVRLYEKKKGEKEGRIRLGMLDTSFRFIRAGFCDYEVGTFPY